MGRYPGRTSLRDLPAACAIGGGVSGFTASTPSRDSDGDPRLIGHRGCGSEFPENTLSAVEEAPAVVDAVELDLRRTATGEIVVIHDATVDRAHERGLFVEP